MNRPNLRSTLSVITTPNHATHTSCFSSAVHKHKRVIMKPETKWPLFRRWLLASFSCMEVVKIVIHISLKFDLKDPIDNRSALILIMAWRWTCAKHVLLSNGGQDEEHCRIYCVYRSVSISYGRRSICSRLLSRHTPYTLLNELHIIFNLVLYTLLVNREVIVATYIVETSWHGHSFDD